MRLKHLVVSGFRGFASRHTFDLDATAVILSGVNGQGKTSLFDAVLWGLSGVVPRVGADDSKLLSLYSTSGEMSVSLDLGMENGEPIRVTRSYGGEDQTLSLTHGETTTRGSEAQAQLLRLLWPPALATQKEGDALCSAITRGVYLQQDVVRQFIETDDDQQRFNAISELVGTGRANELQLALDRAKKNWTRATNQQGKDNEDVLARVEQIRAQLAKLDAGTGDAVDAGAVWDEWWARARLLGLDDMTPPSAGSNDAPRTLDAGIKQIEALRQRSERKIHSLRLLLDEYRSQPSPPSVDVGSIELRERSLRAEAIRHRAALEQARKAAAEQRRKQITLQEKAAELRALAEIALRHLDGDCPVCSQEFDRLATEQRLRDIAGQAGSMTPDVEGDSIAELSGIVEDCEKRLAAIVSELETAKSTVGSYDARKASIEKRLQDFRIVATEEEQCVRGLESAISDHSLRDQDLAALARDGEALGLRLTKAREQARRTELTKVFVHLEKEAEAIRAEEGSRKATGEVAGEVLEALREAGSDLVESELKRIEPLFQRTYAAIEPHPTFRAVRLLSTIARGRGRLTTQLQDTTAGIRSTTPGGVLSSSQMNVLAVSVFIAFNLGFGSLPLQTALLDDPLQSLDDINLLGLVDLLRRVSERRQLIISTHDQRFSRLLERKLRPVSEGQRTVVISFDGWGRNGPITSQRDVALDNHPMRLVQ